MPGTGCTWSGPVCSSGVCCVGGQIADSSTSCASQVRFICTNQVIEIQSSSEYCTGSGPDSCGTTWGPWVNQYVYQDCTTHNGYTCTEGQISSSPFGCSDTSLCTDTDGGKNHLLKGTTTVQSESDTDVCTWGGTLIEYYCNDNQIGGETYDCSHLGASYICSDGACVCSHYYACTYWERECGDDGCGGSCGTCPTFPHSVMTCGAIPLASQYLGKCIIQSCTGNYGNCDHDSLNSNGCETSLTSTSNCGSCGHACGPAETCNSNGQCVGPTAVCGNGAVEGSENCDDGNTANGDGCSSSCNPEPGWSCTWALGQKSVCTCSCSDDGNPCTTDACVSGSCQHTPIAAGTACTSDSNECTSDVCSSSGTCVHNALTGSSCSSDGNSCTGDSCTALGVCGHPALTGDDCTTDNNACTNDVCSSSGTCAHNTINSCIDGDGCCPSGCNSGNDDDCVGCSSNGQCTEGNSCTTPKCSGGTCSYPPIAGCCTSSNQCNDYNACTSNICVGTCTYPTINNCCTDASDCSGNDICVGNSCVAPTGWCGDGSVNSAGEDCDGSDLNGETCASQLGAGYTGTLSCSGCSFDTSRCYISSAPCGDGYCDSSAGETCESCSADCTCDVPCGDGYCDASAGETCDTCSADCTCNKCGNGHCDNGENCATCNTDCGCTGVEVCQSGSCVALCGNGLINPGEDCDGGNLGGETCASVLGPEYTGDLGCSSCYFDTSGCYLACKLTSASWSKTMALEGSQIKLNLNGENCDGQSISFTIMEKDGFLNPDDPVDKDPSNILYASPNTYGIWTAEWQDDSEFGQSNPPEYYFTATAERGATITSSKNDGDMLNVYQEDVACSGVNYCANYLTEDKCQVDLCSVGVASAPSSVSCGGTFNPETGCYDYTSCGCAWDSNAKTCEANWQSDSACGICGNHIKDTGEQCDDGNLNDGDGCSSTCQFEKGIPSPCTEGLTLCSDGTCSLNCDVTDEGVADCNYNGVCNVGEGCTCKDCNNEQDTCKSGLICNIIDSACCSSESNHDCNPYCAHVDPDCVPAVCGNGFKELGEECDLGERNNVSNSGCSSTCKYVILDPPCPEGTNLCNDSTCSLNCFATDEGIKGCGEAGACAVGLQCSAEDKACCKWSPDGFCDSYCAFVDPDCQSKLLEPGLFSIGTCLYTENGKDTCEGDGMLTRSLSAQWNWSTENTFSSNPDGLDYWQPTGSEVFRYDPMDYSGLRKSQNCVYIEDTFACPASAEVSFFGIYQLVIAVALVVLIYLIYALKKKNNSKHVKKHSRITVRKRRK